jgi:hypothetical protein
MAPDPELTDRIIAQGRALVRAIEALGTIEPTGPPAAGRLQAPPAGHREGRAHLGEREDTERVGAHWG